MPRRAVLFLCSGEAVGYPEGILVREFDIYMELFVNIFCICLGEQGPTVVGMEIGDLNLKDAWVNTFGTTNGRL